MESKVFAAANVVGSELLATKPGLLDIVIHDLAHRLARSVMDELEKGESICSLQTAEQNQLNDLNSVNIVRKVKIQRLVRCGECTFSDWDDTIDGKQLCYCMKHWSGGHTKDDFCSYGEREVQDADS